MTINVFASVARLAHRVGQLHWAIADQCVISGVNFVTSVLMARFLGVEEFGRFTLAWTVVTLIRSVQYTAVQSPMMSIGPKKLLEQDTEYYYASVFVQQTILCTVMSVLVAIGTFLASFFPSGESLQAIVLPLAAVCFTCSLQDFSRRYFFAVGRGANGFAYDAVCYLSQLVLLFWFFLQFGGVMDSEAVLWITSGAAAVATIIACFSVGRLRWSREAFLLTTKRHWRSAKWLLPSVMLEWGEGNIFYVAAAVLLGTPAVGAVRATSQLACTCHIFFLGIQSVVPVESARRYAQKGFAEMEDYLRKVAGLGALATAIICGVLATFPRFWLELAFGEEFVGYSGLVRWWAIIYVVIFLTLPLRIAFRSVEKTGVYFAGHLAATVVALLSAYPLCLWLGLNGVMVGFFLTNGTVFAVLYAAFLRERRWHAYRLAT